MKERVEEVLEEKIKELNDIKKDKSFQEKMEKTIEYITSSIENGGKVLICGNGGSAADAQHIAAEFVGRFVMERKGFPAIALTTDTSNLTAIANDYSYDDVFRRQVEALGNKGDILIGISTSGNSENVIRAIEEAKNKGMIVIGLTGKTGGKMKEICDVPFVFEIKDTARIQELHMMTYHLICEFSEKTLKEYYEKN